MTQQQKILIADSDPACAELTRFYLMQALYETKAVGDASAIPDTCAAFQPDLVLMEAVFPGEEKLRACRELRQLSSVPIILLSAECEVPDRVHGLDAGADDYLVKPYDARELLARIRAVLRRYRLPAAQSSPSQGLRQTGQYVEYPDLVINLTNYSILYKGKFVETPPKELELLYFLASAPNQVFSREQLLDRLWGFDYLGDTRTVDVHIKRLREKFPSNSHWAIKTVWGVGYKFEAKK